MAKLCAGRRLIRSRLRARRPRGELVGHLAAKLTRGRADRLGGHVTDVIRRVTANAEADRRAERDRPGVLATALGRRFGPPYLLLRDA